MSDKTKDTELAYACCVKCKRYKVDWVDKNHYRPLTLFNVVLPDGKRAKACQDHVNEYVRLIKDKNKQKAQNIGIKLIEEK